MNFTFYIVLLSIALSTILSVFAGQSTAFFLSYILKFDVAEGHLGCLFAYFYYLKR